MTWLPAASVLALFALVGGLVWFIAARAARHERDRITLRRLEAVNEELNRQREVLAQPDADTFAGLADRLRERTRQ